MTNSSSPEQSTRSTLQWVLGVALLVMLAAAGYLLRESMELRDQIAKIEKERDVLKQRERELQQQISTQKSAESKTNQELSEVRKKLLRAQRQLASPPKPQEDLRDVKIIELSLLPQTRAFGKVQLLPLPAEVDYVGVTLQLDGADFSEYQVALKDLNQGKILWQSGKLKPVGKAIQFGMPAKLVEEENYIFELSGISEDDVPKIISGFPFRAVMQ